MGFCGGFDVLERCSVVLTLQRCEKNQYEPNL